MLEQHGLTPKAWLGVKKGMLLTRFGLRKGCYFCNKQALCCHLGCVYFWLSSGYDSEFPTIMRHFLQCVTKLTTLRVWLSEKSSKVT